MRISIVLALGLATSIWSGILAEGVDGCLLAVSAAFEGEIVMINSTCVRVHQHGATGKKGDPAIVAWDVPEAASPARSMPSSTLMVVLSPCD